jgi:hypothetical protein
MTPVQYACRALLVPLLVVASIFTQGPRTTWEQIRKGELFQ